MLDMALLLVRGPNLSRDEMSILQIPCRTGLSCNTVAKYLVDYVVKPEPPAINQLPYPIPQE